MNEHVEHRREVFGYGLEIRVAIPFRSHVDLPNDVTVVLDRLFVPMHIANLRPGGEQRSLSIANFNLDGMQVLDAAQHMS
jgi:hypothetical protein